MASAAPNDQEHLSTNIREQFLQCKICLDAMKEPKTLPCLHTFCADCLHYHIGHTRIDLRKFPCPVCRRQIYIPKSGVDGFPDSFFLTHLSDIMIENENRMDENSTDCGICKFKYEKNEAVSLCSECKMNLCTKCCDDHSKSDITKTHTLLPVQKEIISRGDNFCSDHKTEVVKFYCETCQTAICLPCTFLDHKEHQIIDIKNIRKECVSEIQELVSTSETRIKDLKSTNQALEDLENELFTRKENTKAEIRRAVQEAIRDMQEQERSLKSQIDEYYETIAISRDSQKLKRNISRLEYAHGFAKSLLSKDSSPIKQLKNRKDAKQNLEEALKFEIPNVEEHHNKVDKFVNFLPGNLHVNIGTLLKCTGATQGTRLDRLPEQLPSTKAMFLHKLRPMEEEYTMGDVIGLAFLPSNDIVVLTSEGRKVKIYTMKGDFKLDFGEDEDIQHPSDMTITQDGDIAIADCGLMGVKVFSAYGTLNSQFGNEDMFSLPISLTTDAVGRFLVLDQDKQRITIHHSRTGELQKELSLTNVFTPQMVNFHNGNIYVSDFQHDTLHIFNFKENNPDLKCITKLSPHTEEDGHFLDCSGTTIDPHGNLLIADMAVDRIHSLSPRGEWSYIIAQGHQFLHPTNIAVSPNGLLAVANQANYILENTEADDDTLELEELPIGNHVCLYRLVKSDI